jgi:hypothetical protein
MEGDCCRIMEGKRGGAGYLLRGKDSLPSANPRGDTTLERFGEHIWREPGSSALCTATIVHIDLGYLLLRLCVFADHGRRRVHQAAGPTTLSKRGRLMW